MAGTDSEVEMKYITAIICALIVSAGIFAGLYSGSVSLLRSSQVFSTGTRTVTVKGLAEKIVDADRKRLRFTIRRTGNDLEQLRKDFSNDLKETVAALAGLGYAQSEIFQSNALVTDRSNDEYVSKDSIEIGRYTGSVTLTVIVTSPKELPVKLLDSLSMKGIGIDNISAYYEFTGLNSVKPQLIEEATKNARASAEKFAKDSGSRVGKIKTANQGQITVEEADESTPQKKKIRVVSTVVYFLND